MKMHGRYARVISALTGLAGMMLATSAFAIGTPSGTPVSNEATVDYTTGTANRTATSAPVAFVVDNLVDVLVTEINGVPAPVVPGQVPADYVDPDIMGFTVLNEGNTTQDYELTVLNLADGQTIDLTTPINDSDSATSNATAFTLYLDDGDNAFTPGTDTVITFLDSVPQDQTRTVWVAGTIPNTAVNGAVIGVSFQATTADAGTGGATTTMATVGGDTAGVDVVFADDFPVVLSTDDGARDGQASDRDAMVVQSAVLTIVKASEVLDDGFGGDFAIPGATVQYSVTVENTGTSVATAVSISDDLSTEIGNGTLAFLPDQYPGGTDIQLDINGAITNLTAEVDGDDGQFQGDIVTVDNITLNPGDIAIVTFQVTIQ